MPYDLRSCNKQVGLLETTVILSARDGIILKLTDKPMKRCGRHGSAKYKNTFYDWRGPIKEI